MSEAEVQQSGSIWNRRMLICIFTGLSLIHI